MPFEKLVKELCFTPLHQITQPPSLTLAFKHLLPQLSKVDGPVGKPPFRLALMLMRMKMQPDLLSLCGHLGTERGIEVRQDRTWQRHD